MRAKFHRVVRPTPTRSHAWALIGLAIFVEAAAVYALLIVPGSTSAGGIPMWLLGAALVPFGAWLVYRGIAILRQTA